MTAALSTLPQTQPVDHSTTDNNIRIRVQNSTKGYGMFPHSIMTGALRELKGACLSIFLYVWEQTVSFRKFEAEIPFSDFQESIAGGARTLREAIRWLEDNDWLTVKKNGNRPQIYGIPISLLEEAGCIEKVQEVPPVGGEAGVAKSAKQKPPVSINRRKKVRKPPSPTSITSTIPVSKEVATLDSGGNFYKAKFSDQDAENWQKRLSWYDEVRVKKLLRLFQIYKVYRGKVCELLKKYDPEAMYAVARKVDIELSCAGRGFGINDFGAVLVSRIEAELGERW